MFNFTSSHRKSSSLVPLSLMLGMLMMVFCQTALAQGMVIEEDLVLRPKVETSSTVHAQSTLAERDMTFETPAPSFKLFPNPVQSGGILSIKTDRMKIRELRLTNSRGHVVFQEKGISQAYARFRIPELRPGPYFVQVYTVRGVHATSLMVR